MIIVWREYINQFYVAAKTGFLHYAKRVPVERYFGIRAAAKFLFAHGKNAVNSGDVIRNFIFFGYFLDILIQKSFF